MEKNRVFKGLKAHSMGYPLIDCGSDARRTIRRLAASPVLLLARSQFCYIVRVMSIVQQVAGKNSATLCAFWRSVERNATNGTGMHSGSKCKNSDIDRKWQRKLREAADGSNVDSNFAKWDKGDCGVVKYELCLLGK
ncbi:hypothetical protein TcasGA2_TC005446 [Tribolium castaneum]|uniref:Uncharacterized protein n=1 Tax=Tribolium castaneum TaxID=7070 RepID=D6WYI2_TRICA|nr:hypothetical protein TcasGA2_TC005446 [Tribolium castaneum]